MAKRAVDRNRIKRIARETFRQHAQMLPNLDIIVLARQATATAEKSQLHTSLKKHWQTLAKPQRGNQDHG